MLSPVSSAKRKKFAKREAGHIGLAAARLFGKQETSPATVQPTAAILHSKPWECPMRLHLALAAAALSITTANAAPPDRPLLACRQERLHFCHMVEPGGGRIIECLWGHSQALSTSCHEVLAALREGRESGSPPPAVAPAPTPDVSTPEPQGSGAAAPGDTDEVGLTRSGGTYRVPARVNDSLTVDFTIDSGATDVLIPADVVQTLVRNGTLAPSDFIGEKTYTLADGSKLPSVTFKLHELRVGEHQLQNVTASAGPAKSEALLGQSFLARFKSWTLDNQRHVVVLTELQ
jgi:clan AA aspartic protease (TIGR02281 family)